MILGPVDLSGLRFVLTRNDLIVARGLKHSRLSKNQVKLPRSAYAPYQHPFREQELIVPRKNPKGSACLVFMLRYRLFMGNNHTT